MKFIVVLDFIALSLKKFVRICYLKKNFFRRMIYFKIRSYGVPMKVSKIKINVIEF